MLVAAAGEVPSAASRGWCSCGLGSARAFLLVLVLPTAADLDPFPLPHTPFPLPAHFTWRQPPHRRPPPGSWSAVSSDNGGRVAFGRRVPAPSSSVPCVSVVVGRASGRLPPPLSAARCFEGAIQPTAAAGSRLSCYFPRLFPRCLARAAETSVDTGCGQCLPPARTAGGRLGPPTPYYRAAAASPCDRHDPHETRGPDRMAKRAAEASTPTRGAVGGGGRPPP